MKGRRVFWCLLPMALATWACGGGTPQSATPTLAPGTPEPSTPVGPPSAEPTETQAPSSLPGPWAEDASIAIRGSGEFVQQTEAALDLLERLAPDAHRKILTYVEVIEQGEHSGMWAFENPPRYEVGDATAFASLPWYASTIAHDATHSELYYNYLLAHSGQAVPQEAWAGVESERFCNAYQVDVLTLIGGSAGEIEYLAGLSGDHCDLDGDGDCDWHDYNARDW
ncbi:MAG: hypothetical protein A2Z17_03850 [Gammaproteobacteria bacterium RBG_16_66_13]|nr:MAG: hypothetical protein A2Z17_03850 [Gammaproteobacteria bacterium RBG_16_66_13]